jgi:predicted nucleic acid-binding protein
VSELVLLDTCVLIDLEHVDLGDLAAAEAAVSAVTIAELAYGLDTDDPIERHARTERYYAVLSLPLLTRNEADFAGLDRLLKVIAV